MQRKKCKINKLAAPTFSHFCWMVWGAGKFVVKTARVYRVKKQGCSSNQSTMWCINYRMARTGSLSLSLLTLFSKTMYKQLCKT